MSVAALRIRIGLRPGDLGRITAFHGAVYGEETDWDLTFEAYVAEGLAAFARSHDDRLERVWMAERAGALKGCIAIVSGPAREAQLRWFLVDPTERCRGLGRRLLAEALAFCRDTGRERVFLWTVSTQQGAIRLYRDAGFQLTEQVTRELWGASLTEERYDLVLRPADGSPAASRPPRRGGG